MIRAFSGTLPLLNLPPFGVSLITLAGVKIAMKFAMIDPGEGYPRSIRTTTWWSGIPGLVSIGSNPNL